MKTKITVSGKELEAAVQLWLQNKFNNPNIEVNNHQPYTEHDGDLQIFMGCHFCVDGLLVAEDKLFDKIPSLP